MPELKTICTMLSYAACILFGIILGGCNLTIAIEGIPEGLIKVTTGSGSLNAVAVQTQEPVVEGYLIEDPKP